jgi:phosphoribosylglycinamide formyltransferase-1
MGHAAQLLDSDPSDAPLHLAVLASGSGSNFEALVEALRREPRLQIVLLVVNRDGCGAQQRADRLGIPCQLVDHTDFESREQVDMAVVQALQKAGVELVVMAGWMRIVTPVLIRPFHGRLLNIHPSLLPAFRGMHAIRQALAAGVSHTGCTVHEVVEDVDAGPVLGQSKVLIQADDDEVSLSARIHSAEHQLLPAVVIRKGLSLLRERAQG